MKKWLYIAFSLMFLMFLMFFNDSLVVSADTVTRTKIITPEDIVFTEAVYFDNTDEYEVVTLESDEFIDFSDIGLRFDDLVGNVSVTVSFDYWVDIRIKNAYIDIFPYDNSHWNNLNYIFSSYLKYEEGTFGSNSDNGSFSRTFESKGELQKFGVVSKVSRCVKGNGKNAAYLEVTTGLRNIVLEYSWDVDADVEVDENIKYEPMLTEDMKNFVGFMSVIIEFVKTDFTILGHTFSYWQVIILSCIGSIAGAFISKIF